jgi:hypothetical protein
MRIYYHLSSDSYFKSQAFKIVPSDCEAPERAKSQAEHRRLRTNNSDFLKPRFEKLYRATATAGDRPKAKRERRQLRTNYGR